MTADTVESKSGKLSPLARLAASNQLAGWLDQGLVSATNFAVLLMIARFSDVSQVGYYAIGFSILILAMTMQDSLVTRPYAIQLFKPPGGPEAHAYGALVFSLMLSAGIGAVLALIAVLLLASGKADGLSGLVGTLALAAPFALGREFARRYSFANLLMRQALMLDAAASIIILAALGILAYSGTLDARSGLVTIGLGGGGVAGFWLVLKRQSFKKSRHAASQTARQSWSFGKWLLASQLTLQTQGYAAHWIILATTGAAATGIYSACLSVVGLSNPFLFGLFNMLTPKFVRKLKDEGEQGLRREAFRDALAIGAIMGTFTLLLFLAGEWLMTLLFVQENYSGHAGLLGLLALAAAIAAMGAPATIALSAVERGRAIAALSFGTCVLGSIAVWFLLNRWGLMGAACGILVTETLGTIARWALFLKGGQVPQTSMKTSRH